jgi:hypothetical protein
VKTTFNNQIYRLRYYYKVISDDYSNISLFASVGKFNGEYIIRNITESSGITSYVERLFSGTVLDGGVIFSYELNPEWHLFLKALYQVSLDESLADMNGDTVSGQVVDITGSSVQIGTSLNL